MFGVPRRGESKFTILAYECLNNFLSAFSASSLLESGIYGKFVTQSVFESSGISKLSSELERSTRAS